MWEADEIVGTLRARGELWEVSPGLVGLRGDPLALLTSIEEAVAAIGSHAGAETWRVPPAIPLETLARAEYFNSFPQWLTVASHLSTDDAVLQRVAKSDDPAAEAASAVATPGAALIPAVCYHCYAALAGQTLDEARVITASQLCWRHEGERLAPLERGWAFTMREIVCLGTPGDIDAFVRFGRVAARQLASDFGLDARVVEAEDPFFAPTARGKALLQRVKGLKRELLLPIGDGRSIAAASINDHEGFFGEAFGIRCADGGWARSGCVAFGVERWLVAVLAAYGPTAAHWPTRPTQSVGSRSLRSLVLPTDRLVALGGLARC
jgi:seryl-tRNA synthetase